MSRIHGKNGQITLNGTVLLAQSKWTVDMKADTAEATAFGDTRKVHVQGLGDMKGTFTGFYDTGTIGLLIAAANAPDATPNTLRITPNVVSFPDQFFEGPAWISADAEGDIKDVVKSNATWVAAPGVDWVTPA